MYNLLCVCVCGGGGGSGQPGNPPGYTLVLPPPIQDGRFPGGEIELHNYKGHRIMSVIPLFHIILMREIHFWCYLDDLRSSWGQKVKLKVILPQI